MTSRRIGVSSCDMKPNEAKAAHERFSKLVTKCMPSSLRIVQLCELVALRLQASSFTKPFCIGIQASYMSGPHCGKLTWIKSISFLQVDSVAVDWTLSRDLTSNCCDVYCLFANGTILADSAWCSAIATSADVFCSTVRRLLPSSWSDIYVRDKPFSVTFHYTCTAHSEPSQVKVSTGTLQ